MYYILIENGPGRTEVELADAIFGRHGYQQRVNGDCSLLVSRRQVERRGADGPADPYRYYPVRRKRVLFGMKQRAGYSDRNSMTAHRVFETIER